MKRKAPKAMLIPENGSDDLTTVLAIPENYRKRLRTTKNAERLNEEIRTFPSVSDLSVGGLTCGSG